MFFLPNPSCKWLQKSLCWLGQGTSQTKSLEVEWWPKHHLCWESSMAAAQLWFKRGALCFGIALSPLDGLGLHEITAKKKPSDGVTVIALETESFRLERTFKIIESNCLVAWKDARWWGGSWRAFGAGRGCPSATLISCSPIGTDLAAQKEKKGQDPTQSVSHFQDFMVRADNVW